MTEPDPPLKATLVARSIRRIMIEAMLVAVLGAAALGILWEMGFQDLGWIIAGIIWITGAPLLEIARLVQQRSP